MFCFDIFVLLFCCCFDFLFPDGGPFMRKKQNDHEDGSLHFPLFSRESWAYPILSNLSLICYFAIQLDTTFKHGYFLLQTNLSFIIWG